MICQFTCGADAVENGLRAAATPAISSWFPGTSLRLQALNRKPNSILLFVRSLTGLHET